jgi:fructoselysine/glucoselysine PTS system EIIB component
MIKLVRIDDRLVHGQVSLTWVPALGIDCLIVANDKASKDDFLKMTLGLARPPAARLLVLSISDAIRFLQDGKSGNLKILVIINSVPDAVTLANEVTEIVSINFGGIRTRDGAKLISKAVALTVEEITLLKPLLQRGLELEVRQVPNDRKQLLQTLIPD